MFSLHSSLTTAYGAPVQKPAWLVQIVLSAQTTLRLSSHAQVTWNTYTWSSTAMNVDGLKVGALDISGSLVFNNCDDAFGATFLLNSVTDKSIKIWGYDATVDLTTNPTAPYLLADGVGGGASFGERSVTVPIRDAVEYRMGLRDIVSKQYGFNTILPAGRVIVINGISFTLERGR